MQAIRRTQSWECDYETRPARPLSRRTKFAIGSVAMAGAGALAMTPVVVTPTMPEVRQISEAAIGLSAFDNPLTVWLNTFTNLTTNVGDLGEAISAASSDLSDTLSDPDIQAELTGMFTNANPQRLLDALTNTEYLERLAAGSSGAAETFQNAVTGLPAILQRMAGDVAAGEFLDAFSEINVWLLVDVLGDGRGELLDAFRVPGDFLEEAGFGPIARILGTTWMDPLDAAGNPRSGYGPGLLSRAVLGNAARAVMAPTITASIQTMEILDATVLALKNGDYETAISELVNAPARITNAFLNGYIPSFIDPETGEGAIDPTTGQPYPAQAFPGIFTPLTTRANGSTSVGGTFDFFFNQAVREVIKALEIGPRPQPDPQQATDTARPESRTMLTSGSLTDVPLGANTVTLKMDSPISDGDIASAPGLKQTPGSTEAMAFAGEFTTPRNDEKVGTSVPAEADAVTGTDAATAEANDTTSTPAPSTDGSSAEGASSESKPIVKKPKATNSPRGALARIGANTRGSIDKSLRTDRERGGAANSGSSDNLSLIHI